MAQGRHEAEACSTAPTGQSAQLCPFCPSCRPPAVKARLLPLWGRHRSPLRVRWENTHITQRDLLRRSLFWVQKGWHCIRNLQDKAAVLTSCKANTSVTNQQAQAQAQLGASGHRSLPVSKRPATLRCAAPKPHSAEQGNPTTSRTAAREQTGPHHNLPTSAGT